MNQCVWVQSDNDPNTWATSCGEVAVLAKESPHDNRMKYCCFCGAVLREYILPEEKDGAD